MSFSRVCSLVVASVIAALLMPAFAAAQPAGTPAPASRDQSFTFTDELVQSSLRRPDMATTRARAPRVGPTLIRHRAHFVPEMLHAVEQL